MASRRKSAKRKTVPGKAKKGRAPRRVRRSGPYGAVPDQSDEVRSFDGSGNNLANSRWGAAGTTLLRIASPRYEGGISRPAGPGRPEPLRISEQVCNQGRSRPHPTLTDVLWAWGQFLDHEMDLSPDSSGEDFPIPPLERPSRPAMEFRRSAFDPATGRDHGNPRQQVNALSAYIDGANVYGVDASRAAYLRRHDGSGKLRTKIVGGHELLPRNEHHLPNAPAPTSNFFIAGDVRANEHAVLVSMHTLFVLEHNRLCDVARRRHPRSDDESRFQYARRRVGAIMQAITYEEFLPALLGAETFRAGGRIGPYRGYDPTLNAGISNLFSTACYRLGHSMLSPSVVLAGRPDRNVPFEELFFDPQRVVDEGIAPYLVGLTKQRMQAIDVRTVDAIREKLFNQGLDLAAFNIQRGRDHGLPTLNEARVELGLAPHRSFSDMAGDAGTAQALAKTYGHPDEVDAWLGGLAEPHRDGAEVGDFIHLVLSDQFRRLRDGDRFWYQNDPALAEEAKEIGKTRLSDVMERNLGVRLRKDVFRLR